MPSGSQNSNSSASSAASYYSAVSIASSQLAGYGVAPGQKVKDTAAPPIPESAVHAVVDVESGQFFIKHNNNAIQRWSKSLRSWSPITGGQVVKFLNDIGPSLLGGAANFTSGKQKRGLDGANAGWQTVNAGIDAARAFREAGPGSSPAEKIASGVAAVTRVAGAGAQIASAVARNPDAGWAKAAGGAATFAAAFGTGAEFIGDVIHTVNQRQQQQLATQQRAAAAASYAVPAATTSALSIQQPSTAPYRRAPQQQAPTSSTSGPRV